MRQSPVDISGLNPAERLELLEQLWDSLSPAEDVEVSEAQRAELARRLDALERGELGRVPLDRALAAIRAGRAPRRP